MTTTPTTVASPVDAAATSHPTQTSRFARLRMTLIATLLGVASVLGFAFAAAGPASAATGTTYVTVCAPVNSANSLHATAYALWWDGSQWTSVSSVSISSGCGTVVLKHNGYYNFETFSYSFAGCTEYVWRSFTPSNYIKQNLPVSSRVNTTLSYYGAYNIC